MQKVCDKDNCTKQHLKTCRYLKEKKYFKSGTNYAFNHNNTFNKTECDLVIYGVRALQEG